MRLIHSLGHCTRDAKRPRNPVRQRDALDDRRAIALAPQHGHNLRVVADIAYAVRAANGQRNRRGDSLRECVSRWVGDFGCDRVAGAFADAVRVACILGELAPFRIVCDFAESFSVAVGERRAVRLPHPDFVVFHLSRLHCVGQGFTNDGGFRALVGLWCWRLAHAGRLLLTDHVRNVVAVAIRVPARNCDGLALDRADGIARNDCGHQQLPQRHGVAGRVGDARKLGLSECDGTPNVAPDLLGHCDLNRVRLAGVLGSADGVGRVDSVALAGDGLRPADRVVVCNRVGPRQRVCDSSDFGRADALCARR